MLSVNAEGPCANLELLKDATMSRLLQCCHQIGLSPRYWSSACSKKKTCARVETFFKKIMDQCMTIVFDLIFKKLLPAMTKFMNSELQ